MSELSYIERLEDEIMLLRERLAKHSKIAVKQDLEIARLTEGLHLSKRVVEELSQQLAEREWHDDERLDDSLS